MAKKNWTKGWGYDDHFRHFITCFSYSVKEEGTIWRMHKSCEFKTNSSEEAQEGSQDFSRKIVASPCLLMLTINQSNTE